MPPDGVTHRELEQPRSSALLRWSVVTTIAQRDLRNDVSAILRRVEAGEEFLVTVSGRPVAELRPVAKRGSVASFATALRRGAPPTPEVLAELERLSAEVEAMDEDGDDRDPWAEHG